jgi:propionyl-CoA carboxylase beta chain
VPEQPNKPYDMKAVLRSVLDDHYFFEVHAAFALNIVVGFGRLGGRPVGIVANQPAHLAGCLDINARSRPRASCASATASTSRS